MSIFTVIAPTVVGPLPMFTLSLQKKMAKRLLRLMSLEQIAYWAPV